MLKKITLLSIVGLMSFGAFAQKAKVREATRELNSALMSRAQQQFDKEADALSKAQRAIDEAIKDDKTKNDAKTWQTRAEVYMNMNHNEKLSSVQHTYTATESLKKAVTLDDKISRDPNYAQTKFQLGIDFYNIAVKSYQNSDYKQAFTEFKEINEVLKEDRPNMFKDFPMVDTVRSQAKLLQAYTAFYADLNDDAIKLFNEAKDNPIVNSDANIYYVLAEAYSKKGDQKTMLSTIEAGRKIFPENENLSRLELNYYLESGNEELMLNKLKDAIKVTPNDPELVFNLGIIYAGLAENAEGAKKDEYNKEALKAYTKALSLDPQDGKFNYQIGAYYFNLAAEFNKEMNDLDYSKQKEYEALQAERNKVFESAVPFLEDARSIYRRNSRNLSHNDKIFYRQSLQALSNIYSVLNKMDNAREINNELDSL